MAHALQPVRAAGDMNIFDLVKDEHDVLLVRLTELEQTNARLVTRREWLFNQLKRDVEIHTQAEEDVLYSLLEHEPRFRKVTLDAVEEHGLEWRLLAELESLPADHPRWESTLRLLRYTFVRHVQREQRLLLRALRRLLAESEAESLAVLFAWTKQQAREELDRQELDDEGPDNGERRILQWGEIWQIVRADAEYA